MLAKQEMVIRDFKRKNDYLEERLNKLEQNRSSVYEEMDHFQISSPEDFAQLQEQLKNISFKH